MQLERKVIPYTTEEAWLANRVHDLTSSDIPCLFNQGYSTYDELFEAKKNKNEVRIENNERMQWGVALQDAIASQFAIKNQWIIKKKTEYIRIPELKLGSSFDYQLAFTTPERHYALLEIKNVAIEVYKNKWLRGFEIEAPPYIELQIQHQLLVSGLEKTFLGVLIGGNQGLVLERKVNPKVKEAILKKAAEFWRQIDEAR